jgi:hypothetical protein
MAATSGKEVKDDDFDIELPAPTHRPERTERSFGATARPLRPEGGRKGERFENEVLDVLGSLDDD